MNNARLFLLYSASALGLVLAGCFGGLDVDNLKPPEDLVEDASFAFIKADSSGIIEDFAKVDIGFTVPGDGFVNNDPSDAERLLSDATTSSQRVFFIEIPDQDIKADHVLKVLSAAAIRISLNQSSPPWKLKAFNTQSVNKQIAGLGLNDVQAGQYYESLAKRINDKVSQNDILVVDLDEVKISPKSLIDILKKPRIIAFSHKDADRFVNFFDGPRQEFLAQGLTAGHVYKLSESWLLRTAPSFAVADINRLSLRIAKVVGALEPHAQLGSLGKIFSQLNPVIKAGITPTIDADVLKVLAQYFQTNNKYLTYLDLDGRTLTEINDKTKENVLAFSEQARKIERIFRATRGLTAESLGVDQIKRGIDQTKAQIEDLRTVDLPEIKRELIEHGEEQRDEIIASTKKQIHTEGKRTEQLVKLKHDETRQAIKKHNEQMAQDTREAVNKELEEKIMAMTEAINDKVNQALKTIIADSVKQTETIKSDVTGAVKREHRLTKDEIAVARDQITKIVQDEAGRLGEGIDRLPIKNRRESASLIKLLGERVLIPYYLNMYAILRTGLRVDPANNNIGLRPSLANPNQPAVPPYTGAQFRSNLASVENAPRMGGPTASAYSEDPKKDQQPQILLNKILFELQEVKKIMSEE